MSLRRSKPAKPTIPDPNMTNVPGSGIEEEPRLMLSIPIPGAVRKAPDVVSSKVRLTRLSNPESV